MSASVRVTRTIKRPVAEVAEVATDPEQLFAHFAGFARLMRVDDSDDDSLWDVFLDVGSYEVGSRVMLRRTSPNKLEWASVRGARNSMRLVVEPFADDPTKSRVVVTLRFELQDQVVLVTGGDSGIGRGILERHLLAGLESLRHQLEYGD